MRSDWLRGVFAWEYINKVLSSRCIGFRALITRSRIWKSFRVESRQVYFINPFLCRLKLGESLQTSCGEWWKEGEREISRDDLERISSGIVQGIGRNIDWSIVSYGNHPPIITTLILPEILMLNDGSQSLSLEICLQLLSLLSWIPRRD